MCVYMEGGKMRSYEHIVEQKILICQNRTQNMKHKDSNLFGAIAKNPLRLLMNMQFVVLQQFKLNMTKKYNV